MADVTGLSAGQGEFQRRRRGRGRGGERRSGVSPERCSGDVPGMHDFLLVPNLGGSVISLMIDNGSDGGAENGTGGAGDGEIGTGADNWIWEMIGATRRFTVFKCDART